MIYSEGWKYRLEEGLAYKLQCQYEIACHFDGDWFSLTRDGWLLIYKGFAWDGATKFPDFDWIKTPSLIHDALHNAIALGVIPTSQNDLIDKELEIAIGGNAGKRWLLKFRGWYVRKATNTANQKAEGLDAPIVLPKLKHEITLAQYRNLVQG